MLSQSTRSLGFVALAGMLLIPFTTAVAGKPPKPGGGGGSGSGPTFSGQATVVKADILGITTIISDTGPLPSSGGALEASLINASVGGALSAQVAHAATIGQGDRSRSEASVANLSLSVGGISVGAGFLMSRASALCSNGTSTSGSSEIVGLVINGQSIVVTGAPNQTINLLLGKVIINEQTGDSDEITVNALHVIVYGVADIVISSSHADIACGRGKPVCDTTKDFVTGGGFITGTPSGAKANFGVAGGIKNGFWGHLTYIDHGNGMKVKGTGITAYMVVNATTRHIEGTAEIDGVGGHSYRVDVSDNGEPGRNDVFTLQLSTGYLASGNLTGGNIQLHIPCR